jgi:hypothetical protein
MPRLTYALDHWGSPDFGLALQKELEQLDSNDLPLQEALSTASYAMDEKRQVMMISASADQARIIAKAGIFYTGVIAGCSCTDDPSPVDQTTEYCEVLVEIDRDTAEAVFILASN